MSASTTRGYTAKAEEDVRAAYRWILGREADASGLENYASMIDRGELGMAQLRDILLTSDEARAKIGHGAAPASAIDGAPIGRHLDAQSNPIEIGCTPDQLQAMFDRIAGNWRHFGETEPHWSVLTNPVFFKETLPHHIAGFFEHGRGDVEQALNYLRRAGLRAEGFDRALDFGCGVGRLTVALAVYAKQVVGVDVSQGHLNEAVKSAAEFGVRNAAFRAIGSVADLDDIGGFDLIISRIVLQHNPPPVMAAIYRKLLHALRPGGVAVIQMPTFIAGQPFSVSGYLDSANEPMEMNALPQHEIFSIVAEEGCRPVEVREDAHLGEIDGLSHTFAVIRPA
jgi:SAM-dependent methyltransferase